MKITKIECIVLRYVMDEVRYNANCRIAGRSSLIVRVYTDSGIVGIGESSLGSGPPESTVNVIEKELSPLIVGEDPLMSEYIWQKCYHNTMFHGRGGIIPSAMSGIDTALWDIKGKFSNLPLYILLGGFSNRVETYASGGFYKKGEGLDFSGKELKEACDKTGYRAAKMKVGRTHTQGNPLYLKAEPEFFISFEDDLQRVRLAREILGPEIKLMVDANTGWDVHHAMRAGKYYDELNVYMFEEPIRTDDYYGSSLLAKSLIVKIAGYETEQLSYRYCRMIAEHAVDIVQPDIAWVGGITEAKKIADQAASYNKECATHVFGSAVILAAGLHLSCGISNSGLLEFDTHFNPLRSDLVKDPLEVDPDGFMTVSEKPGLGIELDEKTIAKYRIN